MGLPGISSTSTNPAPVIPLVRNDHTGVPLDLQPNTGDTVQDLLLDRSQLDLQYRGFHLNGAICEEFHDIPYANPNYSNNITIVTDFPTVNNYQFELISSPMAYLIYETSTQFINIHQLSFSTCKSFTYSTAFLYYTPQEELDQCFAMDHEMVGGIYAPHHSILRYCKLFLRSRYNYLGITSLIQHLQSRYYQ